jgi:two-component system, LuxR family, sensor kinase FixL
MHDLVVLLFPTPALRDFTEVVVLLQAVCIVALVVATRRRIRAQRALDERLQYERLLGELSADFVSVLPDYVDDHIGRWLGRLLQAFEVDRTALVQFSAHTPQLRVTHVRDIQADTSHPRSYRLDELKACVDEFRRGRVVRLNNLSDLPPKGTADRETLEAAGVRSMLAVPLSVGGQTIAFLALIMSRRERVWTDETEHRLQLVGEVFANAIMRRNSDRALRSSDALSGAVLASLSARVAVLDRQGFIIRVNDAWLDAALVVGADRIGVGANYLEVCLAAALHEPAAQQVAQGIEQVLAGEHPSGFRLEYAATSPAGDRWYELVVEPLRRSQRGAVVMLTDTTARKRVEMEAQMHRAEVAHAARAATLGELAAGLAHELNQPLAAILTNVEATRRLLTTEPSRTELLREILDDIAADDVRASEIIRRMRALLQRGQMDVQRLDVNELIRDVLQLVASDAILRRVRVHPMLEPDLPGVCGDRVQLQQVILNLLVNGLEAMGDTAQGRRRLIVRTTQFEESWVDITVRDHGPGIPTEVLSRIYEPFFTTKRDGLGMGLSICRFIVEAHGGQLQASNLPDGGAALTFRLPIAGTSRRADEALIQERRTHASFATDGFRRR